MASMIRADAGTRIPKYVLMTVASTRWRTPPAWDVKNANDPSDTAKPIIDQITSGGWSK